MCACSASRLDIRVGTLAEYVAIEARNLAPLPGDVDFTVGASLPISGLTAWQGLFQHVEVDELLRAEVERTARQAQSGRKLAWPSTWTDRRDRDRSRGGYVIGNISGWSLRRLVWSVGGNHRIRTIFASHKAEPSDKRSVTSSPCHCVGDITASCTAPVTRPRGGIVKESTRYRRRGLFGSKAIRCSASTIASQQHLKILSAAQPL
jgi:hypothetical protein